MEGMSPQWSWEQEVVFSSVGLLWHLCPGGSTMVCNSCPVWRHVEWWPLHSSKNISSFLGISVSTANKLIHFRDTIWIKQSHLCCHCERLTYFLHSSYQQIQIFFKSQKFNFVYFLDPLYFVFIYPHYLYFNLSLGMHRLAG